MIIVVTLPGRELLDHGEEPCRRVMISWLDGRRGSCKGDPEAKEIEEETPPEMK